MSPSSPINELDRRNVTLFCDVISGNPATLNSVKWFMDGVLLKQLPMCHNELEYDIIDAESTGANNDEDDPDIEIFMKVRLAQGLGLDDFSLILLKVKPDF